MQQKSKQVLALAVLVGSPPSSYLDFTTQQVNE